MRFDLSQAYSRIRLRGGTRVDFLQRMSTGDLRQMQPGECRATVLTTPIGRMVDYLLVVAQDDSLLLLGQGGAREKTLRWLRKHIFFSDDVQVNDESAATELWAEFGVAFASRTTADGALALRAPAQLGDGHFIVMPKPDAIAVNRALGDISAWDAYRIAQGYPTFPNEISEDYIPLEAGLWGAVSFSKGCYTGQEIIARMESRAQISKKLCILVGDVEAGVELLSETGEPAGKVTSTAPQVALGYIRSSLATEHARLQPARGGTAHWVTLRAVVRI